MRSRSFFLELAMEHYIDELLNVCGVSRANLLYEETLENGLHIQVYPEGELVLEGGDVEENLKNRNIFKDYVPNITTLNLGDGVEIVDEKCFQGWDKLTKVILGNSVREIRYAAFSDCKSVTDVSFGKNVRIIAQFPAANRFLSGQTQVVVATDAIGSTDQKHCIVQYFQNPLHFSRKIDMPRSVYQSHFGSIPAMFFVFTYRESCLP